MARDINDKLDFLEISRKSMSQLQILLIETEVTSHNFTRNQQALLKITKNNHFLHSVA